MRRILLAVGMCLVFGFTFGVAAQQKAPESYEKLMKEMQQNVGKASMAMRSKNDAEVATSAAALKGLFAEVGKFWAGRKAEDAVEASNAGEKAAGELETAAKANNAAGMMAARRSMIIDSCQTCHKAHREKMADGHWGIK